MAVSTGVSNGANAAARSKARRSRLIDATRKRQLLRHTVDQLVPAIADSGYRAEIDLYANRFSGAELIEVALAHSLSRELDEVTGYCQGSLKHQVAVYTDRFAYQNAKTVLRAVHSEVPADDVASNIMPEENVRNAVWLNILRSSDNMRQAVEAMEGWPWWRALLALPAEASLQEYEDALDMHYYAEAITATKRPDAASSTLRRYLQIEIDERNILNLLRALREGLSADSRAKILLPAGRVLDSSQLRAAAQVESRDALVDLLRRSPDFDATSFEEALAAADAKNTLDPVVQLLEDQRHAYLKKMGYLHPLTALPVIHYIASKVEEVAELRMMARGIAAGLSAEVLEAHMNI